MHQLAARYDARAVEAASRSFWTARGLLEGTGVVGSGPGSIVHQFLGTVFPIEDEQATLHRLVAADAHARYLGLTGRRTWSTLQVVGSAPGEAPLPAFEHAAALAVRALGWPDPGAADRPPAVQAMVERLARDGLLVVREHPVRVCTRCREPRTPETIIYQEEEGVSYLLKFPLRGSDPPTSALVTTDAAWKILGTTAVLVAPDRTYVRVRYRRRGVEEHLLVARDATPSLQQWLPGASIEELEERPGREWVGMAYDHPLAVEYPTVARLPPPAGTIVASTEVGDGGTGVVLLVPAHGGADAMVAHEQQLPGWPVITLDGHLEPSLAHKYTRLPMDVAEAFILRDLATDGFLFAEPKVRRGVPHCGVCGSTLTWHPSRTWCVELGRLPRELSREVERLLPGTTTPTSTAAVPWPASEGVTAEDGPALRECPQCERLAPPDAAVQCTCGAATEVVRRRLLPAVREALTAWTRHLPFRPGEELELFVPDRRRLPSLVHLVIGLAASAGRPGTIRLTLLPTLPPTEEGRVGSEEPADAVRAAFLRTDRSPRVGPTLGDRRRQEARRLRKLWATAGELLAAAQRSGFVPDRIPVAAHAAELLPEDRALVSIFEGLRLDVVRRYESGDLGGAAELLSHFWEHDLRQAYLPLVAPRLRTDAVAAERLSAFRVLWHVVPAWTELYAPIAPSTCEAVHRAFVGDTESLFQARLTPVQEGLRDPKLDANFRRWQELAAPLFRARRRWGVPDDRNWSTVVVIVPDDAVGAALRSEKDLLRRLLKADRLEVGSPSTPWEGRRITVTALQDEMHRAYPSEAPRIVRLVGQLSGRRVQDGLRANSLTVALDGRSIQILPHMVELTESLPERHVPIPWVGGSLFAELPPTVDVATESIPPALSLDAFRVVDGLRRRISRAQPDPVERIWVWSEEPLKAELRRHELTIGRMLGVPLGVEDNHEGFASAETFSGRTRRGARWSAWTPGVAWPATRRKARPARVGGHRVVVRIAPIAAAEEIDYLDEELRARDALIRETAEQLETTLGSPIIGPTKLGFAWEAGIQGFGAISTATYEQLAGLRGFGPHLAATIVGHFGGVVPAPRGRPDPAEPGAGSGAAVDPSRRPAGETATGGTSAATTRISTAAAATSATGVETTAPAFGGDGPPPSTGPQPLGTGMTAPGPGSPGFSPAETPPPPPRTIGPSPPIRETPISPEEHDAPEPLLGELPPEVTDPSAEIETPRSPTPAGPEPVEASALAQPEVSGPVDVPRAPDPAPETAPPAEPTGLHDIADAISAPGPSTEAGEVSVEPAQSSDPSRGGEASVAGDITAPPHPSPDLPAPVQVATVVDSPESEGPPPEVAIGPAIETTPPPAAVTVDLADRGAPGPSTSDAEAVPGGGPDHAAPVEVSVTEEPVRPDTPASIDAPIMPGETPETRGGADPASPGEPAVPGSPEEVPDPVTADDASGSAPLQPPDSGSEEPPASREPTPPDSIAPGDASHEGTVARAGEPMVSGATPESVVPSPPEALPVVDPIAPTETALEPTAPPSEETDVEGRGPLRTAFADSPVGVEPEDHAEASVADEVTAVVDETVPIPVDEAVSTPPDTAVVPSGPAVAPAPVTAAPPPSGVELWYGNASEAGWLRFLESTSAGLKGLCLTREFPDRVRGYLGPRDVALVWISNAGRPGSVRPSDLEALESAIRRGLSEDRAGVVYVGGVEYLLSLHPAEAIVQFLHRIDAIARGTLARVIVPLEPTLAPRDRAQELRAAFPADPLP